MKITLDLELYINPTLPDGFGMNEKYVMGYNKKNDTWYCIYENGKMEPCPETGGFVLESFGSFVERGVWIKIEDFPWF